MISHPNAVEERDWSGRKAAPALPAHPIPRPLIAAAALLVLTVSGAGGFAYWKVANSVERDHLSNLRAIALLKAEGAEAWLGERRKDTLDFASRPDAVRAIAAWDASRDPESRELLLDAMRITAQVNGADSVTLLDPQGRVLLGADEGHPASAELSAAVSAADSTGAVAFVDLHRPAPGSPQQLGFVAPVRIGAGGEARIVAGVEFEFPAERFLYPYLRHWPLSTGTGELVLSRRAGDQVEILDTVDPRGPERAARPAQIPVSTKDLPTARYFRGEGTSFRGIDYLGTPVLATLVPVAGTPWLLTAKEDVDEAFGELQRVALLIGGLGILALAAALGSIATLWQRQRLQTVLHDLAQERRIAGLEQGFRETFEQAAVGMAHIALDGTWLRVNDRLCQILGYSRAELEGLAPETVIHPDDLPIEAAAAYQLVSGEIPRHSRDTRNLRADGSIIWGRTTLSTVFDEAGKPAYLIWVLEDISGAKSIEEALRKSEHRLKSAIRGPGVGIGEQDLDLRYSYLEVVFAEHTYQGAPLRPELFIGRTDHEIFGADDDVIAQKFGVIESGTGVHIEQQFTVDDGDITFEVWIEPRRNDAGEVLGVICTFIDITERRNTEQQLRQAQKMEAIGQLTGGLAHDFNNLIGIVLGNLDLLAERFEPGTEERDLTDPAIRAAERGAELTRQLLAFSRRQPLAPKRVHLPPVLAAMGQLLPRILGEAITVELKVADTLWPVSIDVAQLESALLNLSVNARDAMPGGGRLTIEASNAVIDGETLAFDEIPPGDYVLFAVSDTGCGMTPAVLAQVFEPFFTTKGNAGTGLGLSMVHGFIKQSGGYTKIYSEPGQGTIVRLYLPRAPEGEMSAPRVAPATSPSGGREMILVVEDNKGLLDLAVRHLHDLGYRTIQASDGVGALEIIKGGTPLDMLFTDVVMPGGMDGRALAEAARRLRPALKVLFTSGFTAAAAEAATEKQFAANLLSKPYRKSELAQRVRATLDASGG
jgi:PAS domain S-box-containing protein